MKTWQMCLENHENAPERKTKNVQQPIDLNDIVMQVTIQEPNDDEIKTEQDKIDEIIRKRGKEEITLQRKLSEKK